jgi:CDP-diacylglycerol--glycerol-3-phosphate 3-phosphatidyltransferase
MTLHALKPRFQSLLRPAVRALHGAGVSANQVTVSTCVVSVLLGAGLAVAANSGQLQWFLLLPPWFLLRMAFNAIDGLLAREFGQISTLGTYLNELSDLVADAALYLPFALLSEAASVLTLLVILLANLAEVAGLLGIVAGSGRRNDGPMGKSDRALVFGLLGLLLGAGITPGAWLAFVLTLVALLLLPTIANRVRHGIAHGGDHTDQ